MSTYIKPAFQIQRVNELENKLAQFREASLEQLIQRPNPKSWSPIEVAKHMVIGHEAYRNKIDKALQDNSTSPIQSEFKASAMPSFQIKRFPPKDGQIRFKMKTMKTFKPVFDPSELSKEESDAILSELENALKELKAWVETYRTKGISLKKFNSAISAMVRFNVPEACEFILCHNERHFLQFEKALNV